MGFKLHVNAYINKCNEDLQHWAYEEIKKY